MKFNISIFLIIVLVFFGLACSNPFGSRLEFLKGELYYTGNVSREEAEKLGGFLMMKNIFNNSPKTVQLDKANGVYQIKMVMKKGFAIDESYRNLMVILATNAGDEVFPGHFTEVHACDHQLKTIVVVKGHGIRLEYNKGELYYTQNVPSAKAKKLGEFLVEHQYFDGREKTLQIDKKNGKWVFRQVTDHGLSSNPVMSSVYNTFAILLSSNVFNKEPVVIELTDVYLNTFSRIEPDYTNRK